MLVFVFSFFFYFRWKMFTEKRKWKTTKARERPLLAPTTAATRLWAWTMHLREQTASSEDRVARGTNLEFISHRTLRDAGVPALPQLYMSVYFYLWGRRRAASRARNAGVPMVSRRPPALLELPWRETETIVTYCQQKKNQKRIICIPWDGSFLCRIVVSLLRIFK